MTELRAKLALAGASLLLCSFAGDQGLRAFGVPTDLPRYANPPGFRELRKKLEFQYDFATNSQGLRYREISLAKPAGTHRVIVLGDSYTEGFGVSDTDTWVSRLERRFASRSPEVSFVNGGLTATGPLDYGRLLLHVGMRYQPDAVLIAIYGNDVSDTPISATPSDLCTVSRQGAQSLAYALWPRVYTLLRKIKQGYDDRHRARPRDFVAEVSTRAAQVGIPRSRIEAWQRRLPPPLVVATNTGQFSGSTLSTGLLRPGYWTDALDIHTDSANAEWRAMSSILSAIAGEARRKGLVVGVVFLPTPFQYDNPMSRDDIWAYVGATIRQAWLSEDSEVQKRLHTWAERERVPFFDLTPVFRQAAQADPDLTYKLDGHWTPSGHAVASKAIGDWLMHENVFPFIHQGDALRPRDGGPRRSPRGAALQECPL